MKITLIELLVVRYFSLEAEGQNKTLFLKPLKLNFSFIELLYIQLYLLGNCIHCWLSAVLPWIRVQIQS